MIFPFSLSLSLSIYIYISSMNSSTFRGPDAAEGVQLLPVVQTADILKRGAKLPKPSSSVRNKHNPPCLPPPWGGLGRWGLVGLVVFRV